jgi:hypothetical protein
MVRSLLFAAVFLGGIAFAVIFGMVLDGQLKIFGGKRKLKRPQ